MTKVDTYQNIVHFYFIIIYDHIGNKTMVLELQVTPSIKVIRQRNSASYINFMYENKRNWPAVLKN